MEKRCQSVALIQRLEGDKSRFLLRWQPPKKRWHFIVADRLDRESFRESIIREVAWQLDLRRQSDFVVANMAQLSVEFIDLLSDSLPEHIAVAFYTVHIYRRSALEIVNQDRLNRWVTAEEVCRGTTVDGQTIDPRMVKWLNNWQVLQPWQ